MTATERREKMDELERLTKLIKAMGEVESHDMNEVIEKLIDVMVKIAEALANEV